MCTRSECKYKGISRVYSTLDVGTMYVCIALDAMEIIMFSAVCSQIRVKSAAFFVNFFHLQQRIQAIFVRRSMAQYVISMCHQHVVVNENIFI